MKNLLERHSLVSFSHYMFRPQSSHREDPKYEYTNVYTTIKVIIKMYVNVLSVENNSSCWTRKDCTQTCAPTNRVCVATERFDCKQF
jgi:hypothetical protein